jgi:hypothetical protein
VVLLAVWIAAANLIPGQTEGGPIVATLPNDTQPAEPVAAAEEPVMPTTAARNEEEPSATAEVETPPVADPAPVTQPIVVASVQDPPIAAPSPVVAPVLDPETTQSLGETTFGRDDLVPLPPKRPRASAIPVPRPRPDLAIEPDPGPILSEAEIARMQ